MENKPEFNIGEMIKMKIDGSIGQIVDMGCIGPRQYFEVRFPCCKNITGNLYHTYSVRLFEMEKYE